MRSVTRPDAQGVDVSAPSAAALVRQARVLMQGPAAGQQLLAGKQLALLSPDGSDSPAHEFVLAASALGARVAFVRPGLDEGSSDAQVEALARFLGRLYDAVECQHMPAGLVQRLALGAGIPVFAGLATAEHPTAALADELDASQPRSTRRRCILQAALLLKIA